MSDELNVLQETAAQARAKADELKSALTDTSSKKERAAAQDAEADAVEAEAAYADAKAEASAAAQGGDQPKVGDPCTNADGVAGTWQQDSDAMVCVVEPPPPTPPTEPSKEGAGAVVPDANESRTGFAEAGLHPGNTCVCPDGRPGTVQRFEIGLICLPNQG